MAVGDRLEIFPITPSFIKGLGQFGVGQDADGDFVAATLVDRKRLIVRRFDAAGRLKGEEITVAEDTPNLANVAVATDASGGFVVVWVREVEGQYQIMVRRYDSNGIEQSCGSPGPFTDCAVISPDPSEAKVQELRVASAAGGDFVVAWRQTTGDINAGSTSIVARVFDHRRNALSNNVVVTPLEQRRIGSLDVAIDVHRNFVVAWHNSDGCDPEGMCSSERVFARRFNRNRVAGEVLNLDPQDSVRPKVRITTQGEFLVAWDGPSDSDTQDVLTIQKYRPDGRALWDQPLNIFDDRVAGEGPGNAFDLSVDSRGRFTVVWQLNGKIRGVTSDASGQIPGSIEPLVDALVREEPFQLRRPLISMDADGDVLLAWAENFANKNDGVLRIRAQRYRSPDPINLKVRQEPISDLGIAVTDARFGYRLKVHNVPMRGAGDLRPGDLDQRISRAIGTATDITITAEVPDGASFPFGFGDGWNCALSSQPPQGPTQVCDYLKPLPAGRKTTELRLEYSAPSLPQRLKHVASVEAAQSDPESSVQRTQVVCPSSLSRVSGEPSPMAPTLEFFAPSANEREGTAVPLTVKVTHPTPGRGLCFKLEGLGQGSADFGSDYGFFRAPASGRPLEENDCDIARRLDDQVFTVPPGMSEVTVALLCLTDDQKIEKAEQTVLKLAGSPQYQLGPQEAFTLTIRDPGK